MRKADFLASLVIGEAAGLLMLAISRNISLPSAAQPLLPWLPLVFPVFTSAVMLVGAGASRYSLGLYQLAKFGLVGGLNFLIDLGVLNILIFATDISTGFFANVFKAVSFLVAVMSSFLWNKFWTFRSLSTERVGKQFVEFFIVSVVGMLVNVGTFALVNDFIRARAGIDLRTWASVSAAVAAAAGLLWNFLGYKFIVFKRPSR